MHLLWHGLPTVPLRDRRRQIRRYSSAAVGRPRHNETFYIASRVSVSQLIISVSGLRGVVGRALTPEVAARFACAFASGLPAGPIVLARDGRASGPALAAAVTEALCRLGRDVIDAQVAATPTVGVLVRDRGAVGGIQISASHNPAEYNGMKLFSSQGRVLTAEEGERVLKRYNSGGVNTTASETLKTRRGRSLVCEDPHGRHLELVLATVDVPRIRSKRFRVLLDSNHGAGSLLGRRLLEALGCRAEIAGIPPDGQFEHPPEPVNENLRDACRLVVKTEADVGFCQDPDADRLAVIDENGRPLGEEYTLALCLDHVLAGNPGAVVTNCATSRISHDVARRHNSPSFTSAVGEANVVEMMLRENAVFGGEGNGGPIDPRVGYVRDSFVGMALLLDFMAVRDKPISKLADSLPRYEIIKQKVSLAPEKLRRAFDELERHFGDTKKTRIDGLRLDWTDRWLLVRGSNTEPIVRVIAEAPLQGDAESLCAQASEVLAGLD